MQSQPGARSPDPADPAPGRDYPAKAKGARPVFFDDGGATDAVVDIVTALAAEVWALTERVHTLEALLANAGHIEPGAVDGLEPDPADADARAAHAAAFTSRVFRVFEAMHEEINAGENTDTYLEVVERAYDELGART